ISSSLGKTFDQIAERALWRIRMLVGATPRVSCYILDLKGQVLGSSV
ncbi:MAG: hypothetical protein HYY32_04660, partial [Chloroflexi bacterium]|nr:hypothetical protein [Chloroflexota bacterium]